MGDSPIHTNFQTKRSLGFQSWCHPLIIKQFSNYFSFWRNVASDFASWTNSPNIDLLSSAHTPLVLLSCAVAGTFKILVYVREFLNVSDGWWLVFRWTPQCTVYCSVNPSRSRSASKEMIVGLGKQVNDRYLWELCLSRADGCNSSAIAPITHPPSFWHFLLLSGWIHCGFCPSTLDLGTT